MKRYGRHGVARRVLTRDVNHDESRIFGVDRRKLDVVATSIRLLAMVPVIGETPIRY